MQCKSNAFQCCCLFGGVVCKNTVKKTGCQRTLYIKTSFVFRESLKHNLLSDYSEEFFVRRTSRYLNLLDEKVEMISKREITNQLQINDSLQIRGVRNKEFRIWMPDEADVIRVLWVLRSLRPLLLWYTSCPSAAESFVAVPSVAAVLEAELSCRLHHLEQSHDKSHPCLTVPR